MIMLKHKDIQAVELRSRIKNGDIVFGGNRKLKTYGLLSCKSGRRMKEDTRVFFGTEKEAIEHSYRPCGHCMRAAYKLWKNGVI